MIYFELNELNKGNIYRKTLSMIEYLCDKYALAESIGIIETANQNILEQLNANENDYSLDVIAHFENQILIMDYISPDPIFQFFEQLPTDLKTDNIWGILVDDFVLEPDNKKLTLMFHVKPSPYIVHSVEQNVLQTKDLYTK